MKLKKILTALGGFIMAVACVAAPVKGNVTAGAETTTLSDFSEDFESYTVGGYIETDETFKTKWVNNVLKGGEAQGMDAHLINVAKVEYESASSDNKVLHLKNTVGNDSFFHIGPAGDYRTKNFTVGFRLKYLVETVSERSWVGVSFRKKAEVHYTGTNNLMFTTQRYASNTEVTGHAYAIINGGSPNDFSDPSIKELFKDVLTTEYSTYSVPSAQVNEDLPWIDYRLEVNEKTYKLYVNDSLVVNCTFDVSSYDYFGYLSLNCCQANVLVDDFYVTNNDTELPPAIDPLPAPVLTYNETENRVEWEEIEGANLYAVYVNGELVATKSRKYYKFEDLAPGEYVVQVKAVSDDTFTAKDSELSASYTYVVETSQTPDNSDGAGKTEEKGGCGSVAGGGFAIVSALGALAFCLTRKKEN